MTCRTIIKPVENPRGLGEVFDKERLIARVRYNLDVIQEEPLIAPWETYQGADCLESVIGKIMVIDKGRTLRGVNTLTLRLQDSRKLDFYWQKADPAHSKYSITSRGNFY
jgi:hypothetical protein